MPVTMGFFGKRTIVIDSNNKNFKSVYKEGIKTWGPYIAGLIEGDGTIVVHNGISKVKYSPIIEIVFNKKDLGLVNYLYNLFNIGKIIIFEKNYVIWRISKIEDAYKLINLVNGYFRTPKYEALVRAIDWINNYIILNENKVYNENNKLEMFNKKKVESPPRGIPSQN